MQPVEDTCVTPEVFSGTEPARIKTTASQAAGRFRPFTAVRRKPDARRFVVHDPLFCRGVLQLANCFGWHVRTVQTGTRVYAPHLLFLVTSSSAVVYAEDQALLRPYADRIARAFGPETDADLIAAGLCEEQRPDIMCDESMVMTDPAPAFTGKCGPRSAVVSCFIQDTAGVPV